MEHSLLHAVQLLGLVVTLGGAALVLALLHPASHALEPDPARDALRAALEDHVARWVSWGALAAALGGLADLFVQTAEVKGETVFGGVELALAVRFATKTSVGQFSLLRIGTLLIVAAAARRSGRWKWWLVTGLALAAAVFASQVSHAAAQPVARGAAIAAQLIHVTSVAAWIGTLIHLLAARTKIETATAPPCLALITEIIRRFSPVALLMASLLAVSGVYGAWRFLATPAAVLTSAYGLTLIVKLTLVLPLLFAGFVNFRVICPALMRMSTSRPEPLPCPLSDTERGTQEAQHNFSPPFPRWEGGQGLRCATPNEQSLLHRFGRMLELEVTAGVLVITAAGILGSVSPPGEEGLARLTHTQVQALLSPDLPTTAIGDPAQFYDLPERSMEDLRYAEFTHNWSGVFVTLMALCWLAQSLGGSFGDTAARVWPLLLVPFAGFIAVAADPEVWWLRQISVREVVSNPQILEHQIGALLVLVLAWLGWRDQRKPAANRPLGAALPVLLIFGSLLLLGHAHSTLTVTDELSNLINVQHAIFGTLALLAGTVRWLSLRGLFPARAARVIWPSLIVALGLLMAFGYREVV